MIILKIRVPSNELIFVNMISWLNSTLWKPGRGNFAGSQQEDGSRSISNNAKNLKKYLIALAFFALFAFFAILPAPSFLL
jgi:hypothetical protein